MSTTTTAVSTDPTAARYQCGSGCGTLTFTWGRQMPEGGRLGTASLGQFVNKPIQVFDAKPLYDIAGHQIGTNWGFQAQDGTFLGRMYVAFYKSIVRFAHFRANDKWPEVSCFVSTPDPRDSREAIENAA
ncbi:MAG TPA: hypothetical protein VF588_18345 [Pyrinomonadaceae bacterium]